MNIDLERSSQFNARFVLCRQLQMQQLLQVLQQQEGFSRLSPAVQQQLCMQLWIKQQQHIIQQQQAAAASAGTIPQHPGAMPQQTPQNLSPRSASTEPQAPVAGQPVVSMSGPNNTGHPAFQRSVSQPGGEASAANWSSDTSPATSGILFETLCYCH